MIQNAYRYVAVIGIDGMGGFNAFANTPAMDKIFAEGSVTHHALSMDPTISAQNWGAMLLGRTPTAHGLTNEHISKFEYDNKEYPSLFTRIRNAFPDAYLTSVANWEPINHGLIEHDVGVDLDTADDDEKLMPKILERIDKKPKFLFVQFDDVDGAGHSKDYGSEAHLKQIEITDGYVEQIFEAYTKNGMIDDTLFIVIADHGGIRRGHGGYTDEEKYVFFGVRGKNVTAGKMGNAATIDIAALVLYALGLEIPAFSMDGFASRVPGGIFEEIKGYAMPETIEYIIENQKTPAFKAENGLYPLFGEDIKLAMFFDSEIKDETGHCSFTEYNTVKYYADGVKGYRGEFGQTGCASTNDLKLENQSFSVAVWIKNDRKSLTEDCFVCGNKDWWWQKRGETGWALLIKNDDMVFSLSCDGDDEAVVTPYPADYKGGWLHIIVTADKENRLMNIYQDFKFVRSFPIEEKLLGNVDSEKYPFFIGNDAAQKHNTALFPNTFNMDDLLVFGKALTPAEIEKLKKYYDK